MLLADDLGQLLDVLPKFISETLREHPGRQQLIEIVLDIGRRPEARCEAIVRLQRRSVGVSSGRGNRRSGGVVSFQRVQPTDVAVGDAPHAHAARHRGQRRPRRARGGGNGRATA